MMLWMHVAEVEITGKPWREVDRRNKKWKQECGVTVTTNNDIKQSTKPDVRYNKDASKAERQK